MNAGSDFVKWIRPAGAALILALFVLVTMLLFTQKGVAVEGYTPTETAAYYKEHPGELCAEINDRLIPAMELSGVAAELQGDLVRISGEEESVQSLRFALIHYFDEQQFIYE